MANPLNTLLHDRDLRFILDVVAGSVHDVKKMLRTLREDAEILEGMLSDDRLLQHILRSPETVLNVSPQLFFTVLLFNVKKQLRDRPYTMEKTSRYDTYLFDACKVEDLLNDDRTMAYLSNMLVSFVKINSFTYLIREKPEKWRRSRFSDFDINTLLRFAEQLEWRDRLYCYKRIADICLFITGVFPEHMDDVEYEGTTRPTSRFAKKTREEYEEQGKHFYRAAATIAEESLTDLSEVLQRLSDNFTLAVKPLNYMNLHYLGFVKKSLFLED
jgi:hypothetical protein